MAVSARRTPWTQLLAGTDLFAERAARGAVMIRRRQSRSGQRPKVLWRRPSLRRCQTEQVTVTGLIHSLRTNLDIKRNAAGLVDAISAEDIGKFPDTDIAAAMQRIPGVTVSRGVSSPGRRADLHRQRDRDHGARLRSVLQRNPVRRPQDLVRRRPAPFDFSSIGADFVSEVDVLKSPDATLSSGAIGATVNIKFPKPFDTPGLKMGGVGFRHLFTGRRQCHAERQRPVQRHLRP